MEEQGALAVTLSDLADVPVLEPPVGETPLWPEVVVSGLFPAETPLPTLKSALSLAPGVEAIDQIVVTGLENRDWSITWREGIEPMRFGQSLWIVPHHLEPPDPRATNLRLDPGLAFGSGTHPSTRLCLEWIDSREFGGLNVVDYGCGSGVLAVAVALKGAARVDGVDIDPQALVATRENAIANGVGDRVAVFLSEKLSADPADIVLANILSGTLIELAPKLGAKVRDGGWLVLAGILEHQAEAVMNAFGDRFPGWEQARHDDWVSLSARARG